MNFIRSRLDTARPFPHFELVSRTAEELLEFDKLREIVARFSTCAPGRRAIESLAPRSDASGLDAEFEQIREAIAYLRSGSELGFGSLADPAGWLARLAVPASVLTAAEILEAASLMDSASSLKLTFRGQSAKFPCLADRVTALADFRSLAASVRRTILPNGELSDDASPQLKRIRSSIGQAREKIQKSLEAILRARGEESREDYVTLRNDRFVIPVRSSDRRAVPGVVHGASATGQTLFVEPLETIELNNRLVQLAEDEAAEIARILAEFTERLRAESGPLQFAASTVADLDSIFARGRFAREFDATIPRFSADNRLHLRQARNPVLEDSLRRKERAVVPISLELGGTDTVMVISGPNTGGKTVALKTVGLAALAGQSGIPVPAEQAELPVFDVVLADIGDEQSISADLSTFSAHVLNLKSMLERATDRTLVLVDEMGTGTAPEEGAALAVALLEEFRARRSLTLATTHHDRLKSYASTTPGIINAAVEFDEENLRPTYRLLTGVPGVSSGIEIARRLGLPPRVIDSARAGLSPETREARQLIAYLHRSRDEMDKLQHQAREELRELEAERRALQTDWVERQRRRIAELEKQFAATTKRLESEVAQLTAEIADRKFRTQAEKLGARRMAKIAFDARADADAAVLETLSASQADLGASALELPKPVPLEELAEGMHVRVRGMKEAVVLRKRDGVSAEIQAGPMRMKIPLTDILGTETEAGATISSRIAPQRTVTVTSRPADEPSAQEINVIGATVEEASRRVDKFLDAAVLEGLPNVRIIHGHGTGALRRGLAEFLATHPLVAKFSFEAEDRGGAAITVVELKS
ncbi:MAG TPA: Smr/MutS family protein [Candidatus Acidoferrales bacterium]|nr:Smr/MutS family protein [Candidatus Acidoferrales bacterium]